MEKEWIPFTIPNLAFHIHTLEMDSQTEYKGMHQHGAVELIQVERGTLHCHLGADMLSLQPGMILLINSHTVHWLEPCGNVRVTYVQVDMGKYRNRIHEARVEYMDEFIARQQVKPYDIFYGSGELQTIFDSMRQEVENKQYAYDSYVKAYIFQLAAFMQRQKLLSQFNAAEAKDLAEIMPVARYIEENYPFKLQLETLAGLIGYDKYRLCRLFKKVTGGTVVEYCNFVRLRQAEGMLANTNCNISETAFACGFTSIQYFNKVFKRYLGCSPSDFKKWTAVRYKQMKQEW